MHPVKGTQVRITLTDDDAKKAGGFWHGFPVGAIATAVDDTGTFKIDAVSYLQGLHPTSYEVITQDKPQKEKAVSKVIKGNTLYAVTRTSDNKVIYSTTDRDFAREVKAEFGGKKEGVIIMTYAPIKEIR